MMINQKKVVIEGGQIKKTDESLFTNEAILEQIKHDKGLWWNTWEKDIKEGRIYVGQWTKDKYQMKWQGLGIIHYGDGKKYSGYTMNGKPDGKGHMVDKKYVYHGNWKDGQFDGHGTYVNFEDEHMYEGEWMLGAKHGKGVSIHQNGAVKYEGYFI